MTITIERLDYTKLEEGMRAASAYTKKTMPELCNGVALAVAIGARRGMPAVTPEKVDTELAVIKTVVIGKRGIALKNRSNYQAATIGNDEAPLAALIVSARANSSSRYNELTAGRYALPKNPFAGVSRDAGRAAMKLLVDKMVKARHKSGSFLKAGWGAAVKTLRGVIGGRFAPQGSDSGEDNRLGSAEPAKEGIEASTTITNSVGMEGRNAESFNRALNLYGGPVLQAALDTEGEKQAEYALKKMEEDFEAISERLWS